jgi:hypothetical protein
VEELGLQNFLTTQVKELWRQGLQRPWKKDFPVHPHQPGNYVLIKTWKENKLEPAWDGPFLVLLTMETAVQTVEWGWTHHTQIKKVPSLTRRNRGNNWQMWKTWWDAVKASPSIASQTSPHCQ